MKKDTLWKASVKEGERDRWMKSGRAGGRKEISRVLHMTSREYHFTFAVRIYFFFLCGDLIGNKNKSRAHLHIRAEKLERKKEGLRFIFRNNISR